MMFDSRGTMIAPLVPKYMIYYLCANLCFPYSKSSCRAK